MPFDAINLPTSLRSAHVQTILPLALKARNKHTCTHHQLELPDGDFIELVMCGNSSHPIVIVLHGLGGCFSSHYIPGMVHNLVAQDLFVVFMHMRGCGPKGNRLPRTFHAADTSELDTLILYLRNQYPHQPIGALGFSLGANIILKWLGEDPAHTLNHAIAVSIPFDLSATADTLNRGFAKVYQSYLLKRLKQMVNQKTAQQSWPITRKQINKIQSIRQFDADITAKVNGFRDVNHYYTAASCLQFLKNIQTPTQLIHAVDDPFVPHSFIPKQFQLSPQVQLHISQHGGHVGFLHGNIWRPQRYLESFIPPLLKSALTLQSQ